MRRASALDAGGGVGEVGELAALGLEGDQLVDVLAGPVVADPPELTALLANISACATTR
jgi:hypothetical protein